MPRVNGRPGAPFSDLPGWPPLPPGSCASFFCEKRANIRSARLCSLSASRHFPMLKATAASVSVAWGLNGARSRARFAFRLGVRKVRVEIDEF